MKTDDQRNVEDFLANFDLLFEKLTKSRLLFEEGQVKKSYETLWGVQHRAERLSSKLSWYRCRTPNGRSMEEATPQEVKQFEQINSIFANLQAQTRTKKAEIEAEMKKKLDDGDPTMDDYEIDVQVCCMLAEDDPLALDDDDNFISILKHPVFDMPSDDDETGEDYFDYNDMAHIQNHPLHGQKHCCFFHEIIDHIDPRPSLDDILRIDEVWIDIKVYHQKYQKLPRLKK